MGTSEHSELTWREKYRRVLRENKTMAAGAKLQNAAWEKLMKDAQILQDQVARLQSDLQAEKMTSTRLGAEINDAGRKANEEVFRLRALCKANGIDPNG